MSEPLSISFCWWLYHLPSMQRLHFFPHLAEGGWTRAGPQHLKTKLVSRWALWAPMPPSSGSLCHALEDTVFSIPTVRCGLPKEPHHSSQKPIQRQSWGKMKLFYTQVLSPTVTHYDSVSNVSHITALWGSALGGSALGSALLIGEGDGTPLRYSCLANPMDGGAW